MRKNLEEYNRKRNFEKTHEPRAEALPRIDDVEQPRAFVIQKHAARRLHYDFRLELDGALLSWAVPKGPSLDPTHKRLAVQVEDHPLGYARFEGSIPKGQYGGGDVIVWDQGTWTPKGNPARAYRDGKLRFALAGEKLAGDWTLVRTRLKGSGDKEQWLLIKERDHAARDADEFDVLSACPESVLSATIIDEASGRRIPAVPSAAGAEASGDRAGTALQGSGAGKSPSAAAGRSSAAFPATLEPQLATLVSAPPEGDWRYEIKFDGYRLMIRFDERGRVNLFTRGGHDWSRKLPEQCRALRALKLKKTWFDGELVVLDENGIPHFQALQNAFDTRCSRQMLLYLFDILFMEGADLRKEPVERRRQVLEELLARHDSPMLRLSQIFDVDYDSIFKSACVMSLEGVIGKRTGSPYVSRRSTDWIKLKCKQRQEFAIIGYTEPKGSRTGFGALLLGVHDTEKGPLRYAGRVGSGFTRARIDSILSQLKPLRRRSQPVAGKVPESGSATWVEPRLVCEVEFAQWTAGGVIRQPLFIALRSDKSVAEIVREQPLSYPREEQPMSGKGVSPEVEGIHISSPDRVVDKTSGTHKIGLVDFYASIADWILPHLRSRPVALLRAPEGIDGEQFFQKHAGRMTIPHIRHLDPMLDPGHDRLMEIDSVAALVGTVQMGAVEYHTWGSTTNRIENPDRIILDLDPDPALPWKKMIEATQLVLSVLEELQLDGFLKTSGGKGMHILIPVARHLEWAEAKAFAKGISQFMAGQLPGRFTARMGPRNRVGKIFIDYLRNGRGASTVSAWSVRARPGLPVSVPIGHHELEDIASAAQWNISNLWTRLDVLDADPWQGYSHRQRISRRMWEKLGISR